MQLQSKRTFPRLPCCASDLYFIVSDKAAMHFTKRTDTVWFFSQGIERSVNSSDSGDDVCAREVPCKLVGWGERKQWEKTSPSVKQFLVSPDHTVRENLDIDYSDFHANIQISENPTQ